MKFKIGDRVAVYEADGRRSGYINKIYDTGNLEVITVDFAGAYHPKQCRLLKKKERRRVWIKRDCFDGQAYTCTAHIVRDNKIWLPIPDDYTEFIEMEKK